MMKKLLFIIAATFFSMTAIAFAAPVSNIYRSIVPEADNTYYIGTTSPSNLRYNGNFNDLTVTGTCTGCGSSASYPFTPTTNYNVAVNSTSTPIWFTAGLMASSTSYFPGSGIWNSSGNVGIGTTTPVTQLDIENMSATSTFRLFGANTYGAKLSLYENANAASGLGGFGFDIFYDGAANALSFTTVESGTPTLQALTLRRSNGNVGIGTSTPGTLLTVSGVANFGLLHLVSSNANGESGLLIKSADDANGGIGTWRLGKNIALTSDAFELYNGSTGNVLTALTSGNVGIGTTTPGQKLSVAGDILGNRIIGSNFISTSTTASTFAGIITSTATSYNTFPYASTTAITASGQFFGNAADFVTTPSYSWGGDTTTGIYRSTTSQVGIAGAGLQLANFKAGTTTLNIYATNGTLGEIRLGRVDSTVRYNTIKSMVGTVATDNFIDFNLHNLLAASDYSSVNSILMLRGDGRVGIGSSTPLAKLSVHANPNDGAISRNLFTIASSTATATTTLFNIDNIGNVGIGTTTPGQKLSVAGDILGNNIIGSYFTGTSTTASTFAGNVGINTTAPASKLHVATSSASLYNSTLSLTTEIPANNGGILVLDNTSATDGAYVGIEFRTLNAASNAQRAFIASPSSSGSNVGILAFGTRTGGNITEKMRIDTTGNVGIGTTSPGQKLSVAGDAYLSGFYNTSQTTGGYKMNGSVVLTASSTSGLTLGGIGAGSALSATTTLNGNTVFGFNAANVSTSTNQTTAIGYRALASLNDCRNAGVGGSGCLLTAVGYNALAANTTGYWNTALGANALGANTTGTQNVGLGAGALNLNTTGSGNVAIGGTGALAANVSGSSNVAIGQQSLTTNTGSNNTGVGTYAGFYNTSGSTNTFMGKEAGMGNVSVTNDSNSVIDTNMLFLGYRAAKDRYGLASTSVMTNSAAIGANAVVGASNAIALGGLGSNAVRVGIGSSTPFAKLSLHAYNGETNINLFAIGSSTASATTTHFTVKNDGKVYAPNTTSSGSAQTGYWCYDADGQFVRTSTTCLVSASRFKEHVGDLDVGLAELMKLRPVSYFLKDTMGDPNNADQQIGFIAEEAQAVDARLVTRNSEGQVQSFRYEQFTALLTKAIQEQQRQIENLKVGVVEIKRSVEEDWQNFFLLLLFAGLIFQQVQINKLRK